MQLVWSITIEEIKKAICNTSFVEQSSYFGFLIDSTLSLNIDKLDRGVNMEVASIRRLVVIRWSNREILASFFTLNNEFIVGFFLFTRREQVMAK